MKSEYNLVSMLFVNADGRTTITVEETRNKMKDHQRGASYGHSDA